MSQLSTDRVAVTQEFHIKVFRRARDFAVDEDLGYGGRDAPDNASHWVHVQRRAKNKHQVTGRDVREHRMEEGHGNRLPEEGDVWLEDASALAAGHCTSVHCGSHFLVDRLARMTLHAGHGAQAAMTLDATRDPNAMLQIVYILGVVPEEFATSLQSANELVDWGMNLSKTRWVDKNVRTD